MGMIDVSPQIHFAPTITSRVHNAPYSFHPKSILLILQQNTITPQRDSLRPKFYALRPSFHFITPKLPKGRVQLVWYVLQIMV